MHILICKKNYKEKCLINPSSVSANLYNLLQPAFECFSSTFITFLFHSYQQKVRRTVIQIRPVVVLSIHKTSDAIEAESIYR